MIAHIDIAKAAHTATVALLDDAAGHLTDLGNALDALKPDPSDAIEKAIAAYQADIKPDAIRKKVRQMKALGLPQTAADIRWAVTMDLRDAIEEAMPE
jgi:hypothetical protein